jgi:hypothetical protein
MARLIAQLFDEDQAEWDVDVNTRSESPSHAHLYDRSDEGTDRRPHADGEEQRKRQRAKVREGER